MVAVAGYGSNARQSHHKHRQGRGHTDHCQTIRRACLSVAALWLQAVAAFASVTVDVVPEEINEGETFQLVIRGDNLETDDADTSALQTDFEILSTQTAIRQAWVNGRATVEASYELTLRPHRTGDIPIPSLNFGSQQSPATTVRVRALDASVRSQIDERIFFEVFVEPDPVYVQAELIYTRRLYYAGEVQLYTDLPGAPEIADSVVAQLGKATSEAVERNGRRFGMIEQRYAIFPERSGAFVVPSAQVSASVRLSDARRIGARIIADEVRVNVLPIPAEYPPNAPWLPARSVTVSESWDPPTRPDHAIAVGEPLRRRIQVQALGNLGSAIAPASPDYPASLKVYPDPPQISENTDGDHVSGSRIEASSIVPSTDGLHAIPPVSITWWDVEQRQVRRARLAGQRLRAGGSGSEDSQPGGVATVEMSPTMANDAPDRDSQNQTAGRDDEHGTQTVGTGAGVWPIVAVASWAITFGLIGVWWWRRGRPLSDASKLPGNGSPRSRSQLRQACERRDTRAMHEALIRYAADELQCDAAEALRRLRAYDNGRALLDRINATRFSPTATGTTELPDFGALVTAVEALRTPASPQSAGALAPLYPSQ